MMTKTRRYLNFMVTLITSLCPLLCPGDETPVMIRHRAFYCCETIGVAPSVDMIVSGSSSSKGQQAYGSGEVYSAAWGHT